MRQLLTARYWCIFGLTVIIQNFTPGALSPSAAQDLAEVLKRGLSYNDPGLTNPLRLFDRDTQAPSIIADSFSSAVAQAVTQEFPIVSVAPASTFKFQNGIYGSNPFLGPLFSERALTLGRKWKFSVSAGYAFIDFNKLNGADMDNIRSSGFLGEVIRSEMSEISEQGCEFNGIKDTCRVYEAPYSASAIRTQIDLQAHVFTPTLRLAFANDFDATLIVPIVNTSIRVKSERIPGLELDGRALVKKGRETRLESVTLIDNNGNPFSSLEGQRYIRSTRRRGTITKSRGSATGVGDIVLRTKKLFWQQETRAAAFGVNFLIPSGNEDDFQGAGETHVSTFLYYSEIFEKDIKSRLTVQFEPHFNLGIDFDADDVDRSSFLFAAGGSLQLGRNLGLTVDFTGRTEFDGSSLKQVADSTGLPDRDLDSCPCEFQNTENFLVLPVDIKRNDIYNFTGVVRYALAPSGSIFFGIVVPLNDDGIRPDFIPSGGLEFTF